MSWWRWARSSIGVSALQQPAAGGQPAPRVVEVDKLKDNLYVMRGGGGNSAVFITADGVIVVDTKNPGWGQPLLDKIKTRHRQADHDASSTPTRTAIT